MAIQINNNITPENSTSAVLSSDNRTLTVTCKDGYVFDGAPTYSFSDDYGDEYSGTATLSYDNKTATARLERTPSSWYPVTVKGNTKQAAVEQLPVTKHLVNCTGDIPDFYDKGATIDITLTANEGFEFNICSLQCTDQFGDLVERGEVNISADKKSAKIHYVLTANDKDITVTGDCVAIKPVGVNYGSINVYKVTDDDLNAFSTIRFTKAENVDLGKYINRLKRIYTNIENGKSDVIKCANFITDISVFEPKTDKVTLDFGTATITDHNKDITDYESTIQLFVPFTGLVSIPNEYIGKEIHLYIDINVITGGGLYRLTCDDIQFQTGECTPSTDVLYRTSDYDQIGGDEWNENLFMGLEPYIILKWYESKNADGRNNDYKWAVISSFTGFNSFDEITTINTKNMLASEQQMIYNALQTGVYIE